MAILQVVPPSMAHFHLLRHALGSLHLVLPLRRVLYQTRHRDSPPKQIPHSLHSYHTPILLQLLLVSLRRNLYIDRDHLHVNLVRCVALLRLRRVSVHGVEAESVAARFATGTVQALSKEHMGCRRMRVAWVDSSDAKTD